MAKSTEDDGRARRRDCYLSEDEARKVLRMIADVCHSVTLVTHSDALAASSLENAMSTTKAGIVRDQLSSIICK